MTFPSHIQKNTLVLICIKSATVWLTHIYVSLVDFVNDHVRHSAQSIGQFAKQNTLSSESTVRKSKEDYCLYLQGVLESQYPRRRIFNQTTKPDEKQTICKHYTSALSFR